jgi:hypothetical protein|eukprot:COSAG01_NODE_7366_length_3235_cov_3.632334_2_plen_205_part_00
MVLRVFLLLLAARGGSGLKSQGFNTGEERTSFDDLGACALSAESARILDQWLQHPQSVDLSDPVNQLEISCAAESLGGAAGGLVGGGLGAAVGWFASGAVGEWLGLGKETQAQLQAVLTGAGAGIGATGGQKAGRMAARAYATELFAGVSGPHALKRSCYDFLEITGERHLSEKALTKRYRQLAMLHHPVRIFNYLVLPSTAFY